MTVLVKPMSCHLISVAKNPNKSCCKYYVSWLSDYVRNHMSDSDVHVFDHNSASIPWKAKFSFLPGLSLPSKSHQYLLSSFYVDLLHTLCTNFKYTAFLNIKALEVILDIQPINIHV